MSHLNEPQTGLGDEEHWLRDTLGDAVGDVEPRHGIEQIRGSLTPGSTAAAGPARRSLVAAGAALVVAATVIGVAAGGRLWGTGSEPGPGGPPSPQEGSSAGAPAGGVGPLPVYYLGDTPAGPRLYRELRAATVSGDALDLAVSMAVSVEPLDPDYRMPWPAGTSASAGRLLEPEGIVQVELDSSVDLSERPAGVSRDEARMMMQQVIHTVQAAEREPVDVVFAREGRPFARLLGRRIPFASPAAAPEAVQAPVWIINPQEGKRTDAQVRVEGRGAFFEANVSWQVIAQGTVVREGFATAEQCCSLSPYSFTLPRLPDGDYLLRVYDADVSGGEGLGEQEDTKSFSIGPIDTP